MCSMEIGQLSYAKLAFEHVKEMEPDFEGINERLTSLYMLLKDKENFMKYNSCANIRSGWKSWTNCNRYYKKIIRKSWP